MTKWYVATMNDAIFIVDVKPHLAPVDSINPLLPQPTVVIPMGSGDRKTQQLAEEIVEAHNNSTN